MIYATRWRAACALLVCSLTLLIVPTRGYAADSESEGPTLLMSGGGYDTFVATNARNSANSFTGIATFNGTDLGDFGGADAFSLVLGGQSKTFKNNGTDVTGVSINYRIYPTGSPSGAFTEIPFSFQWNFGDGGAPGNLNNPGDQQWGTDAQGANATDDGVEVLTNSGLTEGSYSLEVFVKITTNGVDADGEIFINNGGANYIATFDVLNTEVTGATGWRMLASPESGLTVGDLAGFSLVQGVAESFPTEDDNVFTYDGAGFVGATSTGNSFASGQGFIWYMWDNDVESSNSFPVDLVFDGSEAAADVTLNFVGDDLLAGNPFQSPINVGAITTNNDGIANDISVWNPNTSSYATLSRLANEEAAIWQGFFVERLTGGTVATSITIPLSAKVTNEAFIGKRSASDIARLRFSMSGDGVADYATSLVVADDATVGYDRFDLTKLTPLATSYVALAFEGEKLGVSTLKATESVPSQSAEAHVLPLALDAVGYAGSLTLTWEPTEAALPNGWAFVLVDNVTGDEVDLLTAERYTFEVGASASKRARTWQEVATGPRHLQSAEARFTLKVGPASAVATETAGEIAGSTLTEAYPNPFVDRVAIGFALAEAGTASLDVFDLLGRRVAHRDLGGRVAGAQSAEFDASDWASGVYVVRLSVDGAPVATRRVIRVR